MFKVVATGLAVFLLALQQVGVMPRALEIVSVGMAPTFNIGDIIWQRAYTGGDLPERGDVITFDRNGEIWIKRIAGIAGDSVQVIGGVLYLNGEAVPRFPLPAFATTDRYGAPVLLDRYREVLPNGRGYEVLDFAPNYFYDTTEVFIVPPGHLFVLGDNRDDSADSRVAREDGGTGFVSLDQVIGYVR